MPQITVTKNGKKIKMYRKWRTITLADGTKARRYRDAKTEREADQKLDELQAAETKKAQRQYGMMPDYDGRTLVEDYLEAWFFKICAIKGWKDDYKKNQQRRVDAITRDIGRVRMCDVIPWHLQSHLIKFADFSADHINKQFNIVCHAFQDAFADGIIDKDITARLERPTASESIENRPLTETEQEYFFKVLPFQKYKELWALMYGCGLRPQEARALSISAFVTHDGYTSIEVTEAVKTRSTKLGDTKTKAGKRKIPVPSWTMEYLSPLLEERTRAYKECVKNGWRACPLLFATKFGTPLASKQFYSAFHKLLADMDIAAGAKTYQGEILEPSGLIGADLIPYSLRHNYATMLEELEIRPKIMKHFLGHQIKKSDVTQAVYVHIKDSMRLQAFNKLERYFVKNPPHFFNIHLVQDANAEPQAPTPGNKYRIVRRLTPVQGHESSKKSRLV